MGSQSKEIREDLSKFKKFLEHFSESKWLGDLVAPEFVQRQKLAVKILSDLQTETQLSLPGCETRPERKWKAPQKCPCCGAKGFVPGGYCAACRKCAHGQARGAQCNLKGQWVDVYCPEGCGASANANASAKTDQTDKTISISPKGPSSFYEGFSGHGSGSSDQLESLAKMSEALAKAFREDVETRKAAEKVRDLILMWVQKSKDIKG